MNFFLFLELRCGYWNGKNNHKEQCGKSFDMKVAISRCQVERNLFADFIALAFIVLSCDELLVGISVSFRCFFYAMWVDTAHGTGSVIISHLNEHKNESLFFKLKAFAQSTKHLEAIFGTVTLTLSHNVSHTVQQFSVLKISTLL